MARRATIIGIAKDFLGRQYDVREARPTKHGFDVLLGWPSDVQRGPGGGSPQVIITWPLIKYLEKMRLTPGKIDLPIGRGPVKRVRSVLGHYWPEDNAEWWREHPDGPGKSFTSKHNWRKKLGLPSNAWTPEMDAMLLEMLANKMRIKDIAAAMGRTTSAIWARRWRLGK
ncbi:MAG: hypothetical protein LBQ10_03830 [Desulfovibrio sp.]|jgi:hypothetical protein|nr:hypothetical protein [Desulfovibrio sp.]